MGQEEKNMPEVKKNQKNEKIDELQKKAEDYYNSLAENEEDFKDRDVLQGCPVCAK